MTRRTVHRMLLAGAAWVVLGAVLPACTSTRTGPEATGPVPPTRSAPSVTPSVEATAAALPDPVCSPGAGRQVEPLPDVTVPPVVVAPVRDPDGAADLAPGFTIPAQVAEAGCVVRYDAPGGCVGAVEITGATIPPVTIPETVVGGRTYPAVTVPGASRPGARAEEVCRIRRAGDTVSATRQGVVREGFSRPGAARPGDAVVPTVRIPPVALADVDVEPVRMRRVEVEAGVETFTDGDRTTSYVAPAAVLFDSDRAELLPRAVAALRRIADRIRAAGPWRSLLVEGHTDDRGDAGYGQELSVRRADAVADWLVQQGFPRDRIRTHGWGETRPAYPNTSDVNRQRNRRVVLTLRR